MRKNILSSYALLVTLCVTGCAGEEFNEPQPAKAAPATANVQANTLAVTATTTNGGNVGTIDLLGFGSIQTQNYDGNMYENKSYKINSNVAITVRATKDTTIVEKFNFEMMGKPENVTVTVTDTVNAQQVGTATNISSWQGSDGQIYTADMVSLIDRSANDSLPHVKVDSLYFKRVVSVVPQSDSTATVTVAFGAMVSGENANAVGDVGEQEVWVTHTQLLPYQLKYELSFAKNGNTYSLSFTGRDNRGWEGNREIVPFSIGSFNDMDTCYVSSTDLISKVEDIVAGDGKEKTVTKNNATYHTVEVCNIVKDHRNWRSNGGGLVGPKMNVYFRTQSLEVTFPRGEKVLVKLDQKTIFGEDKTSTNNALKGGVVRLPNEDTEYVYAHSYTYSASHYVTCTVVDWDGERNVPITILPTADSDGWQQLQYNVCTTNLYVLK